MLYCRANNCDSGGGTLPHAFTLIILMDSQATSKPWSYIHDHYYLLDIDCTFDISYPMICTLDSLYGHTIATL